MGHLYSPLEMSAEPCLRMELFSFIICYLADGFEDSPEIKQPGGSEVPAPSFFRLGGFLSDRARCAIGHNRRLGNPGHLAP